VHKDHVLKINKQNLLNCAKATRERKNPSDFTMEAYVNHCGTPGCLLGEYAASNLQNVFTLGSIPEAAFMSKATGAVIPCTGKEVLDHFGINADEAHELFGIDGCNNATTNLEAADYVENFVREKEAGKRYCGTHPNHGE
jgi:hypothetical protein